MRAEPIIGITFLVVFSLTGCAYAQRQEDSLVLVGHSPRGLFPALGKTTISVKPGEDIWMRALRTIEVLVSNQLGNIKLKGTLGPNRLVRISFSEVDLGVWSLNTVEGQKLAEIIVNKVSWAPMVKVGYSLDTQGLHISTEGEDSTFAVIESDGRPNIFPPEARISVPAILGDLGFPYILEVRSPKPLVIDAIDNIVKQNLMFRRTVLSKLIEEPKDAFIVLPMLHKIGAGGVAPLRFGQLEIAVLNTFTLEEVQKTEIFVMPEKYVSSISRRVTNSITIDPAEVMKNPQLKIIAIHGDSTKNQQFERTIQLPISSLVVEDLRHQRLLESFTISAASTTSVILNRIAYIIYESETTLNPNTHPPDPIPVRKDFYFLVNGFPDPKTPTPILTLAPGESNRLLTEMPLLEFTLFYHVDTQTPTPEDITFDPGIIPDLTEILSQGVLTIDTAGYISTFPALNSSLYLPKNTYNITLEAGGRKVWKVVDLSDDKSITLALDPPREGALIFFLQAITLIESSMLGALLFIQKKRPNRSNE